MASERVSAEQQDVCKEDQGTDSNVKPTFPYKGRQSIPPEDRDEDHYCVPGISMDVLENQRKPGFSHVVFSGSCLSYGACRRIEKEGAIVGFAIVVTAETKNQRKGENPEGG